MNTSISDSSAVQSFHDLTGITENTSAAALRAITPGRKSTMHEKVMDVCISAHRNGIDDLTASEMVDRYLFIHGVRIKDGAMSGRISELVADGRLEKLPARVCTSSGNRAKPVRVVAQQVGMF